MKIRVVKVSIRTFSKLIVTLDDPIFQGSKLTDKGNRLVRILTMYTKQFELLPHAEKLDNYTAEFMVGENVTKFYTQTTLQDELDKYANTPVKLQFAVEVWDKYGVLKMPAQVVKSQEDGVDVSVAIGIKSNLPLIEKDVFLLKKFVPGGDVWLCRSPGCLSPNISLVTADMGCVIPMSHKQVTEKNPWVLAKKLQSQIQKAIV